MLVSRADQTSAMPPIHHRDPGVIGLLGDPSRSPYYGIIVDGLHSHPNTVRIAYGAKKDGCILVTDGESYYQFLLCTLFNNHLDIEADS